MMGQVAYNNAQVPAGSGVKDSSRKTDLLYNEYIVYDVAQVHTHCICAHNINMDLNPTLS